LVNGDDLIALGYKPSPEMGKMLAAIRDGQLNGELKTKEQAIEWAKINFPLH
jgi:hypothetical protein